MLVKISLIVALCSGAKMENIQSKLAELKAANPNAEVSIRIDKKAACYKGQVLTGKNAKLLQQLN